MTDRIRVAIGPSSFAQADRRPLQLLQEAGVEVVTNPYGRRLDEAETRLLLDNVDGLLAGLEPLSESVLESAPKLRAIARVGIGMSNVDIDAAGRRGIKVSNTPAPPTEAVAELTLTSLLYLARRVGEMNRSMHDGNWNKQIGRGIRGSVALVVGMGRIGNRVAQILALLGARVLAYDPYAEIDRSTAEEVDLREGLALADFVLLHASGDQIILGPAEFEDLKEGALLLNAGRGGLVDEACVLQALNTGLLGGIWFDVFKEEPYHGALVGHPKALLTPHVGTYTVQCRLQMETEAVHNLLRDLDIS